MNKTEFGLLLYKNNPTKFREYFKSYGNSIAEIIKKATKQNLQDYFNKHWDFNEKETNKVMNAFIELYGPADPNARFDWSSIGSWITGGSESQTTVTESTGNTGVIIAGSLGLAIIIAVVIWKMN